MKKYMLFVVVFLTSVFFVQAEEGDIPKSIRSLVTYSSNIQATLVGQAKYEDTEYFLVNEIGENTGEQKLISLKDGKAVLVAQDTFLFPLNKYKLPDSVIRELADQYVQSEIQAAARGLQEIQERFDKSPEPLDTWISPDLKAAYQKAGIKFH